MPDTIVPFAPGFLEPCARLFRTVFNASPWNDQWTGTNAREHLREVVESPGFVGLVGVEGGRPVAFAVGATEHWSNRFVFYLKEMCVRRNRQRQGLGGRLLKRLEADLKARGVDGLYLMTRKETPAVAFYRKHGYFVVDAMLMMVHPL